MKKNGFTLIELLVIMTILAILAVIMTGTLNPIALINRAGDARRKKDINRIKIALEEYMSDKGTLPTELTEPTLSELNSDSNCGIDIFAPWLSPWPCDPSGGSYKIAIDTEENPPSWFVILTRLKNEKDSEIPDGWDDYETGTFAIKGGYTTDEVNFGVSSSNISWQERDLSACINVDKKCYVSPEGLGSCQEATPDGISCSGSNCYVSRNCEAFCKVSYCRVVGGTLEYH